MNNSDVLRNDDIIGHKTLMDGTHIPLTRAEGKALLAKIEANEARKAALMPTTFEAMKLMFEAFDRLRQLGWRSGIYCPKDGSQFAFIEHGSTGIFTGHYVGEWPNGHIHGEDCLIRPEGILCKPLSELTEWEELTRIASSEAANPKISGRTLSEWKELSKQDDCFSHMVPSDLRAILNKVR